MASCYQFPINVRAGGCAAGARRVMSFIITNVTASPITIAIDFENDGADDYGPTALASSTAVTVSHDYVSGATYTAKITFTLSDGTVCAQYVTVVVPRCCEVSMHVRVDDDCDDGEREVIFTVENEDEILPVSFSLDYGDGTPPDTGTIPGDETVILEHNYDASTSSTYTAVLTITDPAGCMPLSETVVVPECPGGPGGGDDGGGTCPSISTDIDWSSCNARGERTMTATVVLTAADPAETVAAVLSLDGAVADSGSGIGVLELSGSELTDGDVELSIEVTEPSRCGSVQTTSIDFIGCTPEEEKEEDEDDDDGGGGGCSIWDVCCWLCGAYAIAVAGDVISATSSGGVGLILSVILSIATIALGGLLLATCGPCKWFSCTLYGLGLAFVAGLALLIIGGIFANPPLVAWGIAAMIVSAAAAGVLYPVYRKVC